MPGRYAKLRPLTTPVPGALVLILTAAALVRIAWIAYVNVHPFDGRIDDTVFYFASAEWLADHLSYRDQYGRYSAHWPPGYSLVLATAFAIFGTALATAKALNVAFAIVACTLTYAIGALSFSRRIGLAAAAIVAFCPGQVYFATLVMTEVYFGALFLCFVALVGLWTLTGKEASIPQVALLGALAGAAALTRAETAIFVATLPPLWLLVLPRWRMPLRYGVIFTAAFALALAPWTVRNAVRFDDFIPIRSGAGGALSSALDPNYRNRAGGILGEAPPLRDTGGYMLRHPWELVPLELDKLGDLYGNDRDGVAWILHERPPIGPEAADRWAAVANLYFFAVLAAAAGGLLTLRRGVGWHVTIAWGLLGWTAAEIVFWPESRYHFPVVPLLAILAAAAASRAWDAVQRPANEDVPADPPPANAG